VKRDRPGMSPNFIIYLSRVLVSVVSPILISCGTLLYAFYFNNQTDQGEEREGLDMEGWRWKIHTVPPAVAFLHYSTCI